MGIFDFLHKKKKQRDLFHGLFLHRAGIEHCVFEKTETEVVSIFDASRLYTNKFEKVLEDIDELFFDAENRLDQKLNRVIFFVPTRSIEPHQKEVLEPYRGVISEIVKNLEMTPIGYVEMFDLFKVSGAKSYGYVEFGDEVVLVGHADEAVLTHRKELSEDADIHSALKQVKSPGGTVLLFGHDSAIVEQLVQKIHDHYTILRLGRTQMIIGAQTFLTNQMFPKHIAPVVSLEMTSDQVDNDSSTVKAQKSAEVYEVMQSAESTIEANMQPPEDKVIGPQHGDVVAGFVLHARGGSRHSTVTTPMPVESANVPKPHVVAEIASQLHEQEIDIVKKTPKVTIKQPRDWQLFVRGFARRIALLTLGLVFCIGASLLMYEYFIHKVHIIITVPTKSVAQTVHLTNVPVTKLSEHKEVSVSIPTTGTKIIGERSKGTLEIVNFQTRVASLSAGTRVYYRDMLFQLDESVRVDAAKVNVAKRSLEASSAFAKASAGFIGPEGNIASGAEFVIGDFDTQDIRALAKDAFIGGTKRTISAVSAADIKQVRLKIAESAKKTSTGTMSASLQDRVTIDSLSDVYIDAIDFSASQGEVSSVLDAKAQVKAQLYTISQKAIDEAYLSQLMLMSPQLKQIPETQRVQFSESELSSDGASLNSLAEVRADVYEEYIGAQIRPLISNMYKKDDVIRAVQGYTHATSVRVDDVSTVKLTSTFVPLFKHNIDLAIVPVK